MSQLSKELENFKDSIMESIEAARAAAKEAQERADTYKQEVTRLTGLVEDLEIKLDRKNTRIRKLMADLAIEKHIVEKWINQPDRELAGAEVQEKELSDQAYMTAPVELTTVSSQEQRYRKLSSDELNEIRDWAERRKADLPARPFFDAERNKLQKDIDLANKVLNER